jgi:hypothetical protein
MTSEFRAEKPLMPVVELHELASVAIAQRNWARYFCCFSSQHRLKAFLSIRAGLSHAEYWDCLEETWSAEEWMQDPIWEQLLNERPKYFARFMMDAREWVVWDELPDRFRVYRGQCCEQHRIGYSWTLSRETAAYFARIYEPRYTGRAFSRAGQPVILVGTVRKSDAFAYLDGRSEKEVIVPRGRVELERIEPCLHDPPVRRPTILKGKAGRA